MKSLLLILFILSILPLHAKVRTHTLLSGVIVTGDSSTSQPISSNKVFHLTGFTSAGAGAASVTVEGSLDNVNFVVLDTLTLTLGTSITSDSGVDIAPWKYLKANVGSISGTDGEVTLTMSVED